MLVTAVLCAALAVLLAGGAAQSNSSGRTTTESSQAVSQPSVPGRRALRQTRVRKPHRHSTVLSSNRRGLDKGSRRRPAMRVMFPVDDYSIEDMVDENYQVRSKRPRHGALGRILISQPQTVELL